jgi:hypothetical protein
MPTTHHARPGAALAALALLLTACTANDQPSTTSTPSPAAVATTLELDSADGSPDEPTALAPGRYAIPFIGAPQDAPWAEIEIPAGWAHDRLHPATGPDRDPSLRRIELLSVASVAPDPCQGAVLEPAGTSVAELMQAMSAQVTVIPGRPRPASIDGYSGQMLPVRVPIAVDLGQCAFANTLVPFWVTGQSWTTVFPGWTYRIWGLHVDGHRLVVLAAHGPQTTKAELAELTAMVESLEFVEPHRTTENPPGAGAGAGAGG